MQAADDTVKRAVAGVEHGAIEGHSIDFIPDNE
jgi:NCS1 family nucleobase:cation symporter-1